MDFPTIVKSTEIMSIVVIIVGSVLIYLGGTRLRDRAGYLGMGLLLLGLVTYIFHEQVLVETFDKDIVGVTSVTTKDDVSYLEVTVPKEDESLVRSMEYSVNELKEMYNGNYAGDKYMDESAIVVIELDPTASYKIRE